MNKSTTTPAALIGGIIAMAILAGHPARAVAAEPEAGTNQTVFPAQPLPPEALHAGIADYGRAKRQGDVLTRAAAAYAQGRDWKTLANRHRLSVDGESVLVEVRLRPGARRDVSRRLADRTGLRVHAHNVPTLFDAWLPLAALKTLRSDPDVLRVRPARRVKLLDKGLALRAGSVITEGVALSGLDPYHALGADGSGSILALIDSGFTGWDTLQTSGDWPSGANLRRFVVDGSTVNECPGPAICSEFDNPADGDHGANTTEIAFDSAPGATFWVYKTRFLSEWAAALDHASNPANHGGLRADVISASLGAPLDGIGDGSACPAIWGSPCGTIAEASELARSRGSLVVNAAGNEREDHWGGLYSGNGIAPFNGYVDSHQWTTSGGNLNQSPFCLPAGFSIQITAHWDDWTNVDHDYDLFLFRRNTANTAWDQVASATDFQDGSAGQSPQEILTFAASGSSGNCSSGSNYALMVARFAAPTDRNLQVITNIGFFDFIPERSLGFPADSAAVFSVGALDAAGNADTQSSFSSEGPVLAPGGGLPPPADIPKPDGMNFSWVSTVSSGAGNGTSTGFNGTSSATPHVAGVAAVLNQLRLEKSAQTATNPAQALHNGLSRVGLDGDNDLGTAGHDTAFGQGRIRLRECSKAISIVANAWHQVALPCERRAGNTIAQTFGSLGLGIYGTDWIISRWDPIAGSYSHLDGTDSLDIAESYWLYSFNPGSGTLTGLVPDLTEAWPEDTVGAPGFGRPYMMSNPRTFALDWDEVLFFYNGAENSFSQAVNDGKIRSMMWLWDPGTETFSEFNGLLGEGQMQPGQAMWMRVLDDVQVRFPTTPAPSALRSMRRALLTANDDWSVTVHLETATDYAAVRFGHHPNASKGFDAFDAERLAPPTDSNLVMALPRNDLGAFSADYVRDFRPPAQKDEWLMEIRGPGGPAILRLDDPARKMARGWLIDDATGRRIPLSRRDSTFRITLKAGTHRLRWQYRKGPEFSFSRRTVGK